MSSRRRLALPVLVVLGLSATLAAADPPDDDAPVPTDVREDVAVRLVLVETLVTDRAGRTVPGLARDDFTLLVDYRPVEIDVLDTSCAAGAVEDPTARDDVPDGTGSEDPISPRQFALVLDWIHAPPGERGRMLAYARDIVERRKAPRDRVLLAVLADGLQIVHPLSSDRDTLVEALDALIEDPRTGTMPVLRGVTERPFFRSLSLLMEVLGRYDGAKAVVLFSPWVAPASTDDLWFLDVAQRAAEARAAIYPIDSFGLTSEPDGPLGGSGALARLANESGGRYTRLTNDLALAYERAERDLGCRYTLGFYLRSGDRDGNRTVTVRVNRPGLSARHPERLRDRTAEDRRRDRDDATFVDPGAAIDPAIHVRAIPMRPSSTRTWQVRIDVDPSGAADVGGPPRRLRVRVERIGLVHDLFDDALPSTGGGAWSDVLGLAPGDWTVTAMVDATTPDGEASVARILARVPAIERGAPFVSGVVVDRDGAARAHICLVDVWPERTTFAVEREVLDAEGMVRWSARAEEIDLDGWRAVRCRGLVDRLPRGELPAGEYRYRVAVEGRHDDATFVVAP